MTRGLDHTRFVLPAWWVKAYEFSMSEAATDCSAMEQVSQSQIAPAMNPTELSALAIVIDLLQHQMLAEPKATTFRINPSDHMKHAGITAKAKRFAFEKVIQLLGGLRVFGAEGNSLSTRAMFSGDRWTALDQGGYEIELQVDTIGRQLILGFGNPMCLEKVDPFLSEQAPLSLWRSIWLDLQGIEQLIWMRMEQAMQWDYRWLQLEGVFGVPVEELFKGLKLPEFRVKDKAAGDLAKQLKLLGRVGKKLCAHGFLKPTMGEQYLALSTDAEDDFDVSLVWQVGRERLLSNAVSDYRDAVAELFFAEMSDEVIAHYAQIMLGGKKAQAAALQKQLLAIDRQIPVPVAVLNGFQLLSARSLFWEWSLRYQYGLDLWKLPRDILSSEMEDMLGSRIEPIEDRFENFCNYLWDNGRVLEELASMAGRTVFAEVTQSDAKFRASLQGNPVTVAAKPKLVPAEAKPKVRKKASLSGALSSKMMKQASEDLERMRKQYPDQYSDLRRSYLKSLDDKEQSVLLNVRKLMQPTLFEDQLRQRLVKYMVSNPGAYRMGSAGSSARMH